MFDGVTSSWSLLVINLHLVYRKTYPLYSPCKESRANLVAVKDRAHLSTFKIFMLYCPGSLFGYCPIIRIGFCVILWKNDIFSYFFSNHIFAIYVGGASLGLPTACRLIAVSGARLPSVDGLVVRCTSTHIHARAWKEKALAGYNSQQIPTKCWLSLSQNVDYHYLIEMKAFCYHIISV